MGEFEAQTQTQISPEIPRDGWKTLIFLQRHSRYESKTPADRDHPTADEMAILGHLTEQGKSEARKRAQERCEAILAAEPDQTDLLIVASPTPWLGVNQFGRRAVETAEVIAQTFIEELKRRRLPARQLLNNRDRDDPLVHDELADIRTDEFLRESEMFNYPDYVNNLREKYHGQGPNFWAARNDDADREIRKKHKAPGPDDDARQINLALSAEAKFAQTWHDSPANAGRRLVIWNVSHAEGLEPYVRRVLGVNGYTANYNDGIAIAIDSVGYGTATISSRLVEVPWAKHGTQLLPLKGED